MLSMGSQATIGPDNPSARSGSFGIARGRAPRSKHAGLLRAPDWLSAPPLSVADPSDSAARRLDS